jgi:hypothetical protein
MSSSNKHSLLRWILGMALGVAASGIVLAGSISDTYTTGDTLTATKMTAIKTAVNDNDTRINNLQTSSGACTKNAGDDTGGVVRVGSICVDKFRARATLGACTGDGRTNCAGVVALSTATGAALDTVSYAQAARACANAGKRLLTPGEWVMVWTMAATAGISEITTDGAAEWVASAGDGGGGAAELQGAYVGPDMGGLSGSGVLGYRLNGTYRTGFNFIRFRCAR